MLLSGLCRELEECIGRFGNIPLSVGAVNGAWLALTGIEEVRFEGADYATLVAGPTSYRNSDLLAKAFLETARDFLKEKSDIQAAVYHDGVLHTFIHLDVDSDIDRDGYPFSVAVFQAYIAKPRFSRLDGRFR